MNHCLDENDVLAFVEGRLRPPERPTVEDHVASCEPCFDLVSSAAKALYAGDAPPQADWATVGPYRLIAPIGCGGSGVVYRADHLKDGRIVALKTVHRMSPGLLDGIRSEIAVLSRLRHPGIVRVLDHGVQLGRPWYAMEFMEGDTVATLKDRLFERTAGGRRKAAGGNLSYVLLLARRLCEPLSYLHAEGLVHRDLKPQNIFVGSSGNPVLVDFGLTRRAPGALGRTHAELASAQGTPAYMAPEQLAGQAVDARADFYSLGCVLYELVTGRPPFLGATSTEIRHQHLHAPPAPMSALVDDVPLSLENLVEGLLRKAPRARVGRAEEIFVALERAEARPAYGHPGMTRPRPVVHRSPLVGREVPLGQLCELARTVRDRQGGAVAFVLGESGIGKTFLSTEVAQSCRGMQIFEGTCLPFEPGRGHTNVLLPFQSLLERIADRCQAGSYDLADTLLGPLGPVLSRVLPRLRELPGQAGYPVPLEESGLIARDRLLEAMRELLSRLAREQPVLLLLDDVHWADDLTLEFLRSLTSEYLARTNVFFLVTCRTEDRPSIIGELATRPLVTTLRLDRLDDSSAIAIVAEMLVWDSPPAPLVSVLARNAEGNPFFLSEYIRAAVADDLLRRVDGAWVTSSDPSTWSLPRTLRELILKRLLLLSPPARRCCEMAAVLGREFAPEMLGSAWQDGNASQETAELLDRQVLTRTASGALTFAHHKLHEVAYEQIEQARRRTMHRTAAERTESRYGTETPATFVSLAQHWAGAEEPARALPYFERAAAAALRIGAYRQATRTLESARSLCRQLEDDNSQASAARRAHIELSLGHAELGLGGPDRSEEHALCALAWLGWKTPRNRWDWTALLARELAVHCVLRTFRPRAAGSDARSRLSDAAVAASLLTQRYYFQNDVLSMTATALLGINAAERSGAGGPAARAYTTMGLVAGLARLRRLSSGYFRDAHRKAEGDLSEIVMAFATEIVAAGTIGRWPQTQAIGRNLADIFTSLKDPLIRGMALATLCWVEFFGERDAAAERRARELISLGRESDNAQYVGWGTYYCARVALRACQYDTALPLLTQALATLENFNERQSSINIVGSLAISHLRTGDPKKALASADQALDYLAGSSPTGFSSLDGPVLAAQVYRELLSVAPPNQRRHLAARWRMARRWLWWLAALFPVAQPSAWLEAGHAFAFKRRTGAARFSFEASRRAAAKYGMTRDCNQAEAALEALRPR